MVITRNARSDKTTVAVINHLKVVLIWNLPFNQVITLFYSTNP